MFICKNEFKKESGYRFVVNIENTITSVITKKSVIVNVNLRKINVCYSVILFCSKWLLFIFFTINGRWVINARVQNNIILYSMHIGVKYIILL